MVDTEEIQVSFPNEHSGEDPEKNASEVQDEINRGDTQNNCMRRLGSMWQAIVIAVLMVLVCGVTGILFIQINKNQSVTAGFQYTAEEVFTMWNITKQLQIENSELKQLLNCTGNLTLLRSEYGQLELFMNATLYNLTLMSAEKTQLSMLLKNTMQEKTHLQVRNKELNMLLKSTMENYSLVEEEKRQLNLRLNKSLHNITMETAENKRLHQLLINEQQTSMQLEAENQKQRSILFSNHLTFLWGFCNKSTLHCSRCLPGWVEHASRCFFLSSVAEKWEVARQLCISMGGDLAIVLNAEDQAFLTNMTFQYVQAHPQEDFHSAWIGLQDMVKEGTHLWINGKTIKWDVIYWKESEPNNAVPDWDTDLSGQDCVAIVPPKGIGGKDWLNSWDDIVCVGKRHYLCETMALGPE
ncbi:low affinity immunoglobulin epsilon Fc receptor-like [Seriola aureovittata]|uniref:low affinity immunoglobulin epsilon Fc receptor-like n=1 Tax=Seriola aureovittata TaxID=2871759 RepID=UPI0024BD87D2|nr:low affinity immunoglobulin epsilon Fc receptor-like [Seriola aureovittata]